MLPEDSLNTALNIALNTALNTGLNTGLNTAVTLEQWLRTRSAGVPDELQARIEMATGAAFRSAVQSKTLTDAAAAELRALLATGVTSRAVALDLLTVDALATYSLEFAASSGEDVGEAANSVLQAVTALVTSDPQPQPRV